MLLANVSRLAQGAWQVARSSAGSTPPLIRLDVRRRARAASWTHLRRLDRTRQDEMVRLARLEGALGLAVGASAMAITCPLYVNEVSALAALLFIPSLFLLWRFFATWQALLRSGLRAAPFDSQRAGALAAVQQMVLLRLLGWLVGIAVFSVLPGSWLWTQFVLSALAAGFGAYILARWARPGPTCGVGH